MQSVAEEHNGEESELEPAALLCVWSQIFNLLQSFLSFTVTLKNYIRRVCTVL